MSFITAPNFKRFCGKTILAIDYGTVVTGFAFFTPGREPYPLPYDRHIYQNNLQLIKNIELIVNEEAVEVIVLGLPLRQDGSLSQMTKRVLIFYDELEKAFPSLDCFKQDETLTSFAAKKRMEESPQYNFKVDPKKLDALSATIILEDFMNNKIVESI